MLVTLCSVCILGRQATALLASAGAQAPEWAYILVYVIQVNIVRGHSKLQPVAHAFLGPLPSSPLGSVWVPRADVQVLTVVPPGPQSQDCIAAALACSKILKELSKEEEDTDSSEEMLALADQYEHRAIGELTGGAVACGHAQLRVLPWGPCSRPQPLSVTCAALPSSSQSQPHSCPGCAT